MDSIAQVFLRQFIGVVVMTLIPVVLTTFLTIPMNLGGVPGASRSVVAMSDWHGT